MPGSWHQRAVPRSANTHCCRRDWPELRQTHCQERTAYSRAHEGTPGMWGVHPSAVIMCALFSTVLSVCLRDQRIGCSLASTARVGSVQHEIENQIVYSRRLRGMTTDLKRTQSQGRKDFNILHCDDNANNTMQRGSQQAQPSSGVKMPHMSADASSLCWCCLSWCAGLCCGAGCVSCC